MDNLQVDFYDEEHASVTTQWLQAPGVAADPNVCKFLDLLANTCFAIRQMRNLGRHPATDALARHLTDWKLPSATQNDSKGVVVLPSHIILSGAIRAGLGVQGATDKYGKPVYLVPFAGAGGRRFVARMGPTRNGTVFLLNAKGFGLGGLLGKDMPQYATDAVALTFAYLATRYREDETYTSALPPIAKDVAGVYYGGRITSLNQESVALSIVKQHLQEQPGGLDAYRPAES